jgi:hypothetical protein
VCEASMLIIATIHLRPMRIFDAIPPGEAGIGGIEVTGVRFSDLDLVIWI